MIRVALIDDHPLILKILRQDLAQERDLKILWESTDAGQLAGLLTHETPDVLVMDLSFAGQGFEPVAAVRDTLARFPRLGILILTANDDPVWIEELIEAGAKGYVIKSDDFSLRLAEGIRAVAQGRAFLSAGVMTSLTLNRQRRTLTTRERSILRLAAEGKANTEIADILGVAHGTIRNHISNIYTKLDVDSREAAVRVAQQLRELPKPDANLRHELRTPLHTLLGLSRLLRTKLDRKGLLEQIITEAERLDHLIGDLHL